MGLYLVYVINFAITAVDVDDQTLFPGMVFGKFPCGGKGGECTCCAFGPGAAISPWMAG